MRGQRVNIGAVDFKGTGPVGCLQFAIVVNLLQIWENTKKEEEAPCNQWGCSPRIASPCPICPRASIIRVCKRTNVVVGGTVLTLSFHSNSQYCGFCSNRILPYFPLSVRQSVGVTSQLFSIIWWFMACKPYIFWKHIIQVPWSPWPLLPSYHLTT